MSTFQGDKERVSRVLRREACLAGGSGKVVVSSAAVAGAAEATIPPSCRGEREWEWGQARAGRAPFQVTSPYHPAQLL